MSKLLIVDDEEDIREFARRFFMKRGIVVEVASNGREALEKIESFQPDLSLFDIRMEQMTGVDALRALRESGNDCKIIMISGMEDEHTVNECQELGVVNFIHKPLVIEELQDIVLAELNS